MLNEKETIKRCKIDNFKTAKLLPYGHMKLLTSEPDINTYMFCSRAGVPEDNTVLQRWITHHQGTAYSIKLVTVWIPASNYTYGNLLH